MSTTEIAPQLMTLLSPQHPLLKRLYKAPILLWRLGLGPIVGQLFMIMTTTGRKSGLPRRTAIEYHEFVGHIYAMAAWPATSDWYRNVQADPRVTLQTASGVHPARAYRLTTEAEFSDMWRFLEKSRLLQATVRLAGLELTRDEFIARRDQFHLLRFDPTDEPTPPPLETDLAWVWPAIGVLAAAVRWLARRPSKR